MSLTSSLTRCPATVRVLNRVDDFAFLARVISNWHLYSLDREYRAVSIGVLFYDSLTFVNGKLDLQIAMVIRKGSLPDLPVLPPHSMACRHVRWSAWPQHCILQIYNHEFISYIRLAGLALFCCSQFFLTQCDQLSLPQCVYILRAWAFTGATKKSLFLFLPCLFGYFFVLFWYTLNDVVVFEIGFDILGQTGCFRGFPFGYKGHSVSIFEYFPFIYC